MYKILVILLFLCMNLIYSNNHSCIVDINSRDIYRNIYTFPESIESENFKIHFTTSIVDSQLVNNQMMSLQSNFGYAQSIIDLLEYSLEKYLDDGWVMPPPDCDEDIIDINSPNHCINFGGNALYDVYIANDAAGMVVPENPYQEEPYIGGYTSYMKISTLLNEYDYLPYWSVHVVAHELHHSIQLRYGYSVSGTSGNYMYNGWFFEQSATYMENVIFPNSNHLLTMLSNCNVVTPLTYPEHGINYPAEIYPYRSALWQKFMVESYGDSSIVRTIWEKYGLEYASENEGVSLFPIYNEAIIEHTQNNFNLNNAYKEYALWRYFTGERNNPNLDYFNQGGLYCESKISNLDNMSYSLYSNTGGVYYFEVNEQINNLTINSNNYNNILVTLLLSNFDNIYSVELPFLDENSTFYFDEYSDYSKILIISSNYTGPISEVINFEISLNSMNYLGDINNDGFINVNDVVILINYILLYDNIDEDTLSNSDMNSDMQLNIMDVVLLVNIILGN